MSGAATPAPASAAPAIPDSLLRLLRCPATGSALRLAGDRLLAERGGRSYRISPEGIPLFAEDVLSGDARIQQAHYDRIAAQYVANLGYPHTQEYLAYLDRALLAAIGDRSLGVVGEICCGAGEIARLAAGRLSAVIGIDVSAAMLARARAHFPQPDHHFVQGDATRLPLAEACLDSVVMLGGIHHVNDRAALFAEIFRVLKPGGRFIFREPVSDFPLWRAIRAVVYRLSPALDHETERPLLRRGTVPVLERTGFRLSRWTTHGFLGFCLFMNSDVLVFNRLFRFVPGIRTVTRIAAGFDDTVTRLPGLRRLGLIVVGVAEKPGRSA